MPNTLYSTPHLFIFKRAVFKLPVLKLLLTGLLLGGLLAAPTASAETLTNADVIKLVKAGLSADTIKLTINSASGTKFDTTANGLAALSKAKVPDSVIQTMIRGGSAPAARAPAPVAAAPRLKTNRRSVQPSAIDVQAGSSYYTRYSLWYERGAHSTTNYSRGQLLPINSRVTLLSIEPKRMTLQLESGETLKIALAKKTSLRGLDEIAQELLSDREVPIARLGKDLSKSISSGIMRLGMTKEQVLMARGYPPRHKTPSLDSDQWIYWSSRFVHRTLVFQDGVLTRGRGLN